MEKNQEAAPRRLKGLVVNMAAEQSRMRMQNSKYNFDHNASKAERRAYLSHFSLLALEEGKNGCGQPFSALEKVEL